MNKVTIEELNVEQQQEKKDMEETKEVRSLMVETLTNVLVLAYRVEGKAWAMEQIKELQVLWEEHGGEVMDFGLIRTEAIESFKQWRCEMDVVYDPNKNWTAMSDEELMRDAKAQAGMLAGQSFSMLSDMEKWVADELVDIIFKQDDAAYLEKEKGKLPGVVALLQSITRKKEPSTLKQRMDAIRLAERTAERCWRHAENIVFGMELDMDADDPTERVCNTHALKDHTDGLDGDMPNLDSLEMHQGQMAGFMSEPNWLHIYHSRDMGREAYQGYRSILCSIFYQNYKEDRATRNRAGKKLNKMQSRIKDYFFKADKRKSAYMAGESAGMVSKEQWRELSELCYRMTKAVVPEWATAYGYQPPVLSWEDHMIKQGKEAEYKARSEERARKNKAEIDAHEKRKSMSLGDYGHYDDEGTWTATDIADEAPSVEQQLVLLTE